MDTNPTSGQTPISPVATTPVAKPLTPIVTATSAVVAPAPKPVTPTPSPAVPAATAVPVATISVGPSVTVAMPAKPATVPTTTPAPAPVSQAPVAQTFILPITSQPTVKPMVTTAPTPIVSSVANAPIKPMVSAQAPIAQVAGITATAGKTAGFLMSKTAMALIMVIAFGGISAFGYFVFPETFYNTVGKYVGMSAPSATEESAVIATDIEPSTEDQTRTVAETTTSVDLFGLLPGADANVVLRFKMTQESIDVLESLKMAMAEGLMDDENLVDKNIEEEYSKLAQNIEEFVIVAKIDPNFIYSEYMMPTAPPMGTSTSVAGTSATDSMLMPPAVSIAIKTAPGQAAFVKGELSKMTAQLGWTFEEKDSGVLLAKYNDGGMEGKFADNPIMVKIQQSDANLAVIINTQKLIGDLLAKNNLPLQKEQTDLAKKVLELSLESSLNKNADKYDFKITLKANTADAQAATDLETLLKPQVDQLKAMIPSTYSTFLTTDVVASSNLLNVEINIVDLKGLVDKLTASAKDAQKAEQEKLKNIYDAESKKLDEAQKRLDEISKKEAEAKAAGRVLRPKAK